MNDIRKKWVSGSHRLSADGEWRPTDRWGTGGGVYTETCSADLFGRVSFERHRLPNADGPFPIRYPALPVPTTATTGILRIEV